MKAYRIQNHKTMAKLLWWDTFLGSSAGLIGLSVPGTLAAWTGLPLWFIIAVSSVTLVYAVFAFVLARQANPAAAQVRLLVLSNWAWALLCIGLLIWFFNTALFPGKIYLLLQVLIVGGLAYIEGRQLAVAGSP